MNLWHLPIVNDELVKLHGEGVSLYRDIAEQINAKFNLRPDAQFLHWPGAPAWAGAWRPSLPVEAAALTAEWPLPLLDLGWRDSVAGRSANCWNGRSFSAGIR